MHQAVKSVQCLTEMAQPGLRQGWDPSGSRSPSAEGAMFSLFLIYYLLDLGDLMGREYINLLFLFAT